MNNQNESVVEVFLAQVDTTDLEAFHAWNAKIRGMEASFPGFKGVFVQPPQGKGTTWLTFLQFESVEDLDQWLASEERKALLYEAKPLIKTLENHRILAPYAGWFLPRTFITESALQQTPAIYKQTMLVLLVLFPIVMLEFKFLLPLFASWPFSLVTFLANALSVALVAWPMMPLISRLFGCWLSTEETQTTLKGIAVLFLCYSIEVLLLSFI